MKFASSLLVPALTLFALDATANCISRDFDDSEIKVIDAYIAYYGRPADYGGLDFWAERIEVEGGDLSAIIDAFGFSQEYSDRFGSLSNADLVSNLYLQLFNRSPELNGLEFYVGELDSAKRSLQSISLDILYGAQNNDLNILANRRQVSQHFVTQSEASSTQVSADFYTGLMATVTGSTSSAIAACASTNTEIVAQGGVLDNGEVVDIGDNRELSAGNDNCSPVKYPADGTVVEYAIDAGNIVTQMITTFISSGQSRLEVNSTIASSNSNIVTLYQTVDDYVFQTEAITVSPTSDSSVTITTQSTDIPPLMLTPATQWCEGQFWFRAAGENTQTTSTGTSDSRTAVSPFPSGTSIVNSIDESVTVGAGTFTTVKVTTDFDGIPGGVGITWADVVTGNIVLQETYDESNNLQSKTEAKDIQ